MKDKKVWADRKIPAALNGSEVKDVDMEKSKENDIRLSLCRTIRMYFQEYCENSSLHGVRYLGERGRSVTERIWWILIFVASIFMCSYMIRQTWNKWNLSPVIVSFAQAPTPVWKVPFPAVTLCSETKSRQKIYNFTEAYHKRDYESFFTPETWQNFQDASLLCDGHLFTMGSKFTNESAIDFFQNITAPFNESFWSCKWTNQHNFSCADLFSPTLTEEGLCYTLNMLDIPELLHEEAQDEHYISHGYQSDWSLEDGYGLQASMDVYPRRALGSGIKAGMTLLLRVFDYDLDYLCRGPIQGFKILLHNPVETPRVSQQYVRIPLEQEVIVAVKPNMITTSPGLKNYKPSRRHCYFPGEKKLRFYKIYTQQNCEMECLTNFTLQECECVSYYMPRSKKTPICGSGSRRCVSQAQQDLLYNEVRAEIDEQTKDEHGDDNKNSKLCNCLPSCTSLTYDAETSQADYNWQRLFQAFKSDPNEFPGVHLSRVNIFFKDTQFITSHRSELYGQTDFLANCGGLLGLFMGFSFLSLVEIIYFLTIRMWCNIKMYGKKMWSDRKITDMKKK